MNKINETTFKEIAKDNPKDLIEVIVGDDKEPDVVLPQAKIQRWSNETNFSIRAKDFDNYSVIEEDGKIIFGDEKKELHLYDLPKGEGMEDGGLEMEWVLYEKPETNVLEATISLKGLNAYYQPPLTAEEIAEGAFRPENVIDSYMFYHATKGGMNRADGMEYKVGKSHAMYRPKAIDANGNWTWCKYNTDLQETETVKVTVPQEFLDNALYPVIVDPTFGYTSIGGTNLLMGGNVATFSKGTPPGSDGYVTKITAYINSESGIAERKSIFWKVSDLSIETGSIGPTTVGGGLAWSDFIYSSPFTTTVIEYYIGFIDRYSSPNRTRGYYDTSSGDGGYDLDNNFGTPAALSSPLTNSDRRFSIYATYETPQVLPLDTYYWRVRAKDEWGVWSDWSATRSLEINAGGGATLRRYTLTTLGTG